MSCIPVPKLAARPAAEISINKVPTHVDTTERTNQLTGPNTSRILMGKLRKCVKLQRLTNSQPLQKAALQLERARKMRPHSPTRQRKDCKT